jgi:hypothetical protein
MPNLLRCMVLYNVSPRLSRPSKHGIHHAGNLRQRVAHGAQARDRALFLTSLTVVNSTQAHAVRRNENVDMLT